ncbi:MAG TPA: hypothetical protein VIV11_00845 [Kofleriaceae bacterium]
MVEGTGIHGQTYSIQVLLPRRIELHAVSLLLALRRWRGDIVLATCSPEHVTVTIPTGDLPVYVQLFHTQLEEYANELIEALAWSTSWHESWDDTAKRCPHSIVIAMTAQRPINYASMLLTFLSVLDTWLHTIDIDDRERTVLHWIPAKQLLTYHQYQLLRTELGPCGPAVNVRVANATGRPGELLADTVGLAELGLPDLQILFSDRDPIEVVRRLRAHVRNVFVGDRLDCAWIEESSIVPPERAALTLWDEATPTPPTPMVWDDATPIG